MANDFAWRLQRWRVSKRLRQKEAAAVFDIPTVTYRTWEKGSRTPKPLTMAEVERRMTRMTEPFRIINEPLSFQDRAYLAVCCELVRTSKSDKGRQITCDIQAAWDLAKAMTLYRESMKQEK